MNFRHLAVASLLATGLAATAPAHANLIVNGSFEGGTHTSGFLTLGAGNTSISGWAISGAGVDWIHDSFWEASDGSYSLDLSATSAGVVTTSTSFATDIGTEYLLTFDMAANTAGGDVIKDLRVSVAGGTQDFSFDSTGRSPQAMGWSQRSLVFTAIATSTSLSFQSLENNAFGPALDNVVVVARVAGVPEPTVIGLLGLGLAAMGVVTRRRRSATAG